MKTEKEKMLAGEPYDCGDTELINRWHKAKQLQKEYNDTPSDDIEKLSSLLDDLIGSRGENVWISAPFFVDYGENIHIYTVFHHTAPQERLGENSSFWKSLTKPVNIGKNVWIGGGSIILPGVTIGDGTTIGAGSVVTKSIPANCIAVGNPCKVIKDNL